jgi:chaperone BCS1
MDWLWTELQRQFQNNHFFSGGLILMVGGAVLAALRHVPGRIWTWIKDQSLIEIDIPDREAAFDWVDKWLSAHAYARDRARRLTVRTRQLDFRERADDPTGDHRPRILFTPAPGEHWLLYRGRLVILNRHRADADKGAQQTTTTIRERFGITILSRNRSLAWQLLDDAREHALPRADRRLTVYHVNYTSWSATLERLPRPPESVVLRAGQMEDLIADVRRFLEQRAWYIQRGVPYRRGYMLFGPPGTGKSSAVVAIASALGMDIAVLNLNGLGMDDKELSELLAEVPANSLVLIEDIDCAFIARSAGEDKANKITFSGLLNAIDGVSAGEGRILFATTNHPERLDPALVRPGRIDRKVEIGLADRDQIRRIFRRFFPQAAQTLVEQFATGIAAERYAMSAIQSYLIRHADSAEDAAACVAELDAEQPASPSDAVEPHAAVATHWSASVLPEVWSGGGL